MLNWNPINVIIIAYAFVAIAFFIGSAISKDTEIVEKLQVFCNANGGDFTATKNRDGFSFICVKKGNK